MQKTAISPLPLVVGHSVGIEQNLVNARMSVLGINSTSSSREGSSIPGGDQEGFSEDMSSTLGL